MAQQGFEEDLLRRWFPADAEETLTPFSESDIREVADILARCARERWSRVPRLYSILRKIGQLDTIDAFIDSDITDVYFPFTKNTLPDALCDHSARLRFLDLQHLVYNTEALKLERHARHRHFSDPTEVPLKRIGELGRGGYGYVDRVVSTISHQEYARKLIPRGKTFKQNKQVLRDFTKELSNLKRLSHKHLVELVGSYTDKSFVALIMLPVANTNLQCFLEKPDLDKRERSFLRPFFGCLTSALSYLHDNRIRHKDIKPSNILIKNDQVYFTDFGTSLDWSGRDNSITETASPTTPRYCAPEVMAYAKRNTSSDIWSFGCVFLEMWTVLKHRTLNDLRDHMMTQGTGGEGYHSNLEAVASWIALLQKLPGPSSDLLPKKWIENMLQEKSMARWNVHTLDSYIGEASIGSSAQHTFKGLCCLELEEETSENSRLSDEDIDSLVVPQGRSQDITSGTERGPKPNGSVHSRTVVVDMVTSFVKSKSLDGATGAPCTPRSFFEHGSSSSTSSTVKTGSQEPAQEVILSTETLSNPTNNRKNRLLRTLDSLPDSEFSIGNCEGSLANDHTPSLLKSPHSSGHESHTNAPPYQDLFRDPVSTAGNQSESTQAANDETLHLRNSASSVSTDSTSYSPITIKRLRAKIMTSCSTMVFPQTVPEKEAACNFDQHARSCSGCYNPLDVYLQGRDLCAKGFAYADVLLSYVCGYEGSIYYTAEYQYICKPNQFWPIFRAGPTPLRAIPSDYTHVRSLLRATEHSMIYWSSSVLNQSLESSFEVGTSWVRLHMCVICKRPLGRQMWESIGAPLETDALSCSHRVHSNCRLEIDRLGCPNERYCSWCPESTLIVQKVPNLYTPAKSVEEPNRLLSMDRDTSDHLLHDDVVARYNFFAAWKKMMEGEKERRQTQGSFHQGQTRERLLVVEPPQSESYHHSWQRRTPLGPVHGSAQYQVPLETESRYSIPSQNSVELPRGTPECKSMYDSEPPSSRPRRATGAPAHEIPDLVPIYDTESDSSRPRREAHQPRRKRPERVSTSHPASSNPRRTTHLTPRGTPEHVPTHDSGSLSSRPRRASQKPSQPRKDPSTLYRRTGHAVSDSPFEAFKKHRLLQKQATKDDSEDDSEDDSADDSEYITTLNDGNDNIGSDGLEFFDYYENRRHIKNNVHAKPALKPTTTFHYKPHDRDTIKPRRPKVYIQVSMADAKDRVKRTDAEQARSRHDPKHGNIHPCKDPRHMHTGRSISSSQPYWKRTRYHQDSEGFEYDLGPV